MRLKSLVDGVDEICKFGCKSSKFSYVLPIAFSGCLSSFQIRYFWRKQLKKLIIKNQQKLEALVGLDKTCIIKTTSSALFLGYLVFYNYSKTNIF